VNIKSDYVTLEYALNGADSRMYGTALALVLNSIINHYIQ